MTFQEVIETIEKQSSLAWVYLPSNEIWSLESLSAVLKSEDVPPEQEDDPDAGIPEFAKLNSLKQVLPVTTLQGIVYNARAQRSDVTIESIFNAFQYYYENDAYMSIS